MKKLLHERLREWAHDSIEKDQYPSILATEELFGFYYDPREEERKLFDLMADEIERCYIPRPRFEDGEPVKVDDEVYYDKDRNGTVESYTVADDGCYSIWTNQIADIEGSANDLVKRPSPKVLDADGVEIKVGDTVYALDDPTPHTVEIAGSAYVRTTDGHQFPHPNKHLTHKEPDSLEKLRNDMAAWNELKMKTFCDEWIDRLSALIERVD